MKKYLAILMAVLMTLVCVVFAGCKGSDNGAGKRVAISFANSSSSWQKNGQTMKDILEKEGFTVDLQYADTAEQQVEQLKKQIGETPNCLVIGAVDGGALSQVLAEAKEKNIAVIAYDRLIMNTDAVSYYASFDNSAVGEGMGEYIEAKLNLKSGAGPFVMEVFAGSPTDNNARFFLSGAMEILQPYIDKGQLVVPSKETSFDKVAIADWNPDNATARMEKLLQGPDAGQQLDVVLCPNDGIAGGVRKALKAGGYTALPIMTGQDAEAQAIEAIKKDEQTMTIFKNPEVLVAKTVRMIKAVVEGTQPDINDISTNNNGAITVPSYLCTPRIIDKENVSLVK